MPHPEAPGHAIPALPESLLDEPLAYLAADHDRHRSICVYLAEAATAEAIDGASARDISRFLKQELHWHFEDERLSLHPPLCQRSADDQEFIAAIRRIEEAHAASEQAIGAISTELDRLPVRSTVAIPAALCVLLRDFARREAENLAFENAVIRVIAEVRLKRGDLDKMRASMKARRGSAGHADA
jgi:hypothetical protein